MKRVTSLIFLLLFLAFAWNTNAQVGAYTFASSSGTYTPITGGTLLVSGTSSMDSWVSTAQTIPSFTFGGVAYTTAFVTSNGQISLGGSAPSTSSYSGISAGVGSGINICPFSADLDRATTTVSSEIRWETVVNEVVFQWQQVKRYGSTNIESFDMQVRMNTSTGAILFVFNLNTGPGSSTSYFPQLGIRTSATDYVNRLVGTGTEDWATSLPGATNTSTCRFTSVAPAKGFTNGLTYTFTPPDPNAPLPPTTPNPANAAISIPLNGNLTWTFGTNSVTYDLKFGPTGNMTQVVTGATAGATGTYAYTNLSSYAVYQWQVIEYNGALVTNGPIWSFTTACGTTTVPFVENFDSYAVPSVGCGTVIDVNADTKKWATTTGTTYNGVNKLSIGYSAVGVTMDDWYITQGLTLTGGQSYDVKFYYRAGSATYPERLEVKWGDSPTVAGMTSTAIFSNTDFILVTYTLGAASFTPATTGTYYVGWHCFSQPDELGIYLDQITIAATPLAPFFTFNPETTIACGYGPVGGYSLPQSYTVAGANLTGFPSNIVVTAPANFQVSLASGSGFGPTLNIPFTTGTLAATTVYVRCAPTAPLTYYTGNITHVGGGATGNVAVTGNSDIFASYCPSGAGYTGDEDITMVQFGSTLNNTTPCASLTGTQGVATGTADIYSNFTSITPTDIMQGATGSISVQVTECAGTAYGHSVNVYFDWNQNGLLTDPGEEYIIWPYASSNTHIITADIAVPFGANIGNTLMRVVCKESSTTGPCLVSSWGETEDYKINVLQAPIGSLEGHVTAATSKGPIEGAVVHSGGFTATTNADGYYSIPSVVVGSYTFTCDAAGYISATAPVEIIEGQTTTQDFALTYSKVQVSPLSFTQSLEPEQTATQVLTISNIGGTGPLTWNATITLPPAKTNSVVKKTVLFKKVEGLSEQTDQIAPIKPINPKSEILWDNTNINRVSSGIVSSELTGVVPDGRVITADDFVIPSAETWTINNVYTEGFSNLTLLPNAFAVEFYDDISGKPGNLIYTEDIVPANINFTTQNLDLTTPLQLAGGHYWLSVYGVYNGATSLSAARWNWYTGSLPISTEASLNDFGGFFGIGAGWFYLSEIGVTQPSCYFTISGNKLAFVSLSETSGTIAPGETVNIDVIFNSAGLSDPSTHTATISISNNALPDAKANVDIPVTLNVAWLTAPAAATNPNPANGSVLVPTQPVFSWTNGARTDSTRIKIVKPPFTTIYQSPYFAGNSWDAASISLKLLKQTTYSWQITSKNSVGSVLSASWSFTTKGEGTLNGTVTDAYTGLPLEGVTITVDELKSLVFTTGADGFYEFTKVPEGNYTVKAELAAYVTQTIPVVVQANLTTTQNITLHEYLDPPLDLQAAVENYVDVNLVWHAPGYEPPIGGIIFEDDFEAYIAGQQLACQNPTDWTTWSNAPCNATEDPYISNLHANSGVNSAVIVQNNDCVKDFGDPYTTGKYSISFYAFIPTGNTGYFNTLQDFQPTGTSIWGLEVYFNAGGAGSINAAGTGAATFTWTPDNWFKVENIVDLDNDLSEIWIGGNMIYSFQWSLGADGSGGQNTLDANDFFGAAATDQMYFDDYKLINMNATAALNEGFEDAFPPAGWAKMSPDGGTGWTNLAVGTTPIPGWTAGTATQAPDGGAYMAFCTWTTGGTTSNDQWLVTPQITVATGDVFSFYLQYNPDTYDDALDIKISTGSQTNPADFTTVIENLTFTLGNSIDWVLYTYTLTDYVAAGTPVYIGFREHVADNVNDGSAIMLDNVYVGPAKAFAMVTPVENTETRSIMTRDLNYVKGEIPAGSVQNAVRSTLEGYNVYRNGDFVAYTTDLSYNDLALEGGTYHYTLTAVYAQGESDPIGPASVVILPAPVLLSAEADYYGVDLVWEEGSTVPVTDNFSAVYSTSDHQVSSVVKDKKPNTNHHQGSGTDAGESCETAVTAVVGVNSSPGSPYWYEFTTAENKAVTISSCITDQMVDTYLQVFDACGGNMVATNDDLNDACASFPYSSAVTFNATAGVSYKIFWDDYWESSAFDFTIELTDICVVECPVGAIPEGEPCGEDLNGGCNAATPAYVPISCGDVFCGTAWADGTSRDTDWYELILDTPKTLTWTVTAEFPVYAFIIDGNAGCAGLSIIAIGQGLPCQPAVATTTVFPGKYWLWVGNQSYTNVNPCAEEGNHYVASLTCEDAFYAHYNVFRDGANIAQVYTGTTYRDEAITNGETYCYKVSKVVTETLETAQSNELCATVPLIPVIAVNPTSFNKVLEVGATESDVLTVSNTGTGLLDFNVDIQFGASAAPGSKFVAPESYDAKSYIKGTLLEPTDAGIECPVDAMVSQPAIDFASAYTADEDAGYTAYQSFSGGGNIGGLRFWTISYYYDGTAWSGCTGIDPRPFTIAFYADNAGQPGTLVSSFLLDLTRVNTGLFFSGTDPIYEYTATFPSNVSMTTGWFSIQSMTGTAVNCWNLLLNEPGGAGTCLQWDGAAYTTQTDPLGFCLTGAPIVPWLTVAPLSGSINGVGQVDLDITFTTGDLPYGMYYADIVINSNDPLAPVTTIPVQMEILMNVGIIQGLVTDATSKGPVEGVLITADELRGYSVFTGADGTYSMEVLPGDYTLTASKAGYTTQTVALGPIAVTQVVTQDFMLEFAAPVLLSATPDITGVNLEWLGNPAIAPWGTGKAGGISLSNVQEKSSSMSKEEMLHGPTVIVPSPTSPGRAVGDDCSDPIVVGALPYSDVNTTCGRGNTYSGTTCLGSYDGGEDIVYQLVLTEQKVLQFNLTTTDTWTGMLITQECPIGTNCIAYVTGSSGDKVLNATLAAGTYYLMIDTWPSPNCISTFTLDITEFIAGPGETCGTADDYGNVGNPPVNGATVAAGGVHWYSFTADKEYASVDVSLCGSAFDTKLEVWYSCDNTTYDLYNDDSPMCDARALQSFITTGPMAAGTTWYAKVYGYSTYFGDYILTITGVEPCFVECPVGALAEGEACGEDLNGGCNAATPAYVPISCGDVYCGTAWADAGSRDTDWYELVLDSPKILTWSVTAEFPVYALIIDGNSGCIASVPVIGVGQGLACEPAIATATVPPGTYWLWVGNQTFEGNPCGAFNNYVAELTCVDTFISYFDVFRDGADVADVYGTTYHDSGLMGGTYCYTVDQVIQPGLVTGLSNELCAEFVPPSQVIPMPLGWNGWSSYIVPFAKASFADVVAPVAADMIISQYFSQLYWPSYGINTMGDFSNAHGYLTKMSLGNELSLSGEYASSTISLVAGWNLIPVISTCNVPAAELDNIPGFIIAWEVAGNGIYYPAYAINTLIELVPGKAYYVKTSTGGDYTFPACGADNSYTYNKPVRNENITSWNDVTYTGSSHAVIFSENATSMLANGDVIGAFTNSGLCAGMVIVDANTTGMSLFADDISTGVVDGFAEGEALNFRIIRPSTGDEFILDVTYNAQAPNSDGVFAVNGLSIIDNFTMSITGINVQALNGLSIYPNPSNGIFNIAINGMDNNINYVITNAQGQQVVEGKLLNSQEIDLTAQPKGIYFIKFTSNSLLRIEKVVVK